MHTLSGPSDESKSRENAWAQPVTKLTASDVPAGAVNLNVNGRHMVGPLQGFGQMWQKTYMSLASHFGVLGQIEQQTTLVDPRVQWREAKNIWHNAAVRSGMYAAAAPLRRIRHRFLR